MNPNIIKALQRLNSFTRGRLDIWMLAGKHLAASRAIVLSDLFGTRVNQSSAGVTALRENLYNALGITGECIAEREENFISKAREIINAN